jgi:hypothetical protein
MRSNTTGLHFHPSERKMPMRCATDPIGDSHPIQPDIDRPALPELWRENLRKRERKQQQKKKPENRPFSPEHRIDDFA